MLLLFVAILQRDQHEHGRYLHGRCGALRPGPALCLGLGLGLRPVGWYLVGMDNLAARARAGAPLHGVGALHGLHWLAGLLRHGLPAWPPLHGFGLGPLHDLRGSDTAVVRSGHALLEGHGSPPPGLCLGLGTGNAAEKSAAVYAYP